MKPGQLLGAAGRAASRRRGRRARSRFLRLWMRIEKALPTIGTWALILMGVAIYGSAVALAGIAVFRDVLPDWFMEWVHDVFFGGNQKVELTLQLLEDWGLIDLLKNTVIGAVVFCVALFGLLILVHLIGESCVISNLESTNCTSSQTLSIYSKRRIQVEITDHKLFNSTPTFWPFVHIKYSF